MLEQFEEAVAQHKNSVFSFAYYYLGNRQEAEDVTQDVLIKLWRNWADLPEEAVGKWLNRVTRNTSYDLLRRRRTRNRFVVQEEASELTEVAPATGADPEAVAEASDFVSSLRRCLAELAEPYRSAMILREIQELTYPEMAQELDMPINTVKTHVHRGRRMLRERWKEVRSDVACV